MSFRTVAPDMTIDTHGPTIPGGRATVDDRCGDPRAERESRAASGG